LSFAAGSRLGPFEILGSLGAGGMGEVYRARDPRLGRDVAVKVLPPELAGDAQRRARFEQEARAASSLNHPHIVHIYDIGSSDTTHYIAMELVEGRTLRELTSSGPLPAKRVLDLAVQVADALAKAHEAGIVHRDLKPENVMVSKEGHVRILDFGLAKLAEASEGDPTTSLPRVETAAGVVMGTVGYMSPEQANGQTVDFRSDQFSLGAILYEAASGQRAFRRKTAAETLAAILREQPDPLSRVNPPPPPPLRWIIEERCLAKDPDDRYSSTRDLVRELKELRDHISEVSSGSMAEAHTSSRRRTALGTVAVLAAVALAGAVAWTLSRRSEKVSLLLHATLTFPVEAPLDLGNRVDIALSPDGTRLVYAGRQGGITQLYLRALDQYQARPIPGTELSVESGNPFFSPSGEWVGFFADGKLKKVSLSGGLPIVLCDAPIGRGGSWGDDGRIVFAPSFNSGLSRVPAAGGAPEVLTVPDAKLGETTHRWPDVLPGSVAVLFTVGKGVPHDWDSGRIVVQSLKSGLRRELVNGGTCGRYVPTGHLVFGRGGSLLAAPMSLPQLALTGAPISLLDGVNSWIFDAAGAVDFAFSRDGALVYVPPPVLDRSLTWVERKGLLQSFPALPPGGYRALALAPDGRRLALEIGNALGKGDIWVFDFARATLSRLTVEGANGLPCWTPDGKRLTFLSMRAGKPASIVWQPSDGSESSEELVVATAETGYPQPLAWSPDGATLLYNQGDALGTQPMMLLSPGSSHGSRAFPSADVTSDGRFSPDGRWLAYAASDSGRDEIYVRAYPGPGEKVQISSAGGTTPRWARGGREILYRQGDKVMAVDLELGPSLVARKPELLFEGPYLESFDVTRDGERLLMIKRGDRETTRAEVNIVQGWFDELRRRVASHGP
jgi:Tol biopolymer transport system component/predicted Ser/Thr protein kinase